LPLEEEGSVWKDERESLPCMMEMFPIFTGLAHLRFMSLTVYKLHLRKNIIFKQYIKKDGAS
jgi:hypothetical protein